jgi:hypothetical protein
VRNRFLNCFQREGDGRWLCIAPAEIQLASGHIEIAPGTRLVHGTRFMDVDLAEVLDRQFEETKVEEAK